MNKANPENPRKICVVVASRANYGRIKYVLKAIQEHDSLELQLVVSASALLPRFGDTLQDIRDDGFTPNELVHVIVEGENPATMAKSTGLAIMEMATTFANLIPDIVLTVADRFETMSTAIAASYMNIPVAHTQGGEVTGNIDESVRHAVTKLSHIHFPATEKSRERVEKLGELPESIIWSGCPAIDIAAAVQGKPFPDRLVNKISGSDRTGAGAAIDFSKPYVMVSQHPVTSEFGSGFDQIRETLSAVVEADYQAIWFWPNVDAGSDHVSKGLRMFRENNRDVQIAFYRSMPPDEYAWLLDRASCIIGNSSSGLREAAFLGVPSVNIGTRQSGRERADNVMDVGYDRTEILAAIKSQIEHGPYPSSTMFGDGNASQKIVETLATCDPVIQKRLTY
ncbi:MAG: UDP-N-acetylglucosamine 2-epimerase (hydrolyzing) [Desulfobulbaceae bacterium]|nr:UDP-N-acetylglucosamine 2-epimerase (hydrolyzing) [Desulfobulbaceae bacterium]